MFCGNKVTTKVDFYCTFGLVMALTFDLWSSV